MILKQQAFEFSPSLSLSLSKSSNEQSSKSSKNEQLSPTAYAFHRDDDIRVIRGVGEMVDSRGENGEG